MTKVRLRVNLKRKISMIYKENQGCKSFSNKIYLVSKTSPMEAYKFSERTENIQAEKISS